MKNRYYALCVLFLLLFSQPLSARGSTVTVLTKENFVQVMQEGKPVFVKFWASWCRPCREMAPKYAKVSRSYVGKVHFTEVNVDQQKEIANFYKVHTIPTTILFIDGKEMDRFTGGLSAEQIDYWANEIIKGRYK